MTGISFFFIVGVGRSGTTLLMCMLNEHPDIVTPPEFHFISQHMVKRPNMGMFEASERLKKDPRFVRLGLDVEDVIRPFKDEKEPFSPDRLYRSILSTYADKYKACVIGDKAPKNIEYLPVLHKVFPECRIIHLIRDPRDVYLSRIKAAWSMSRPDTLQFLAYRAQYGMGHQIGLRLFGDNYLEVHYEELLKQPETELKCICDFLEVPFSHKMMNFSNSARRLVFSDEINWKKEALGPLLINNKDKWRSELPSEKVARIEAACSPVFKKGFYTPSQQGRTLQSVIRYRIIDGYMAILSELYHLLTMAKNRRILRFMDS
ncbi:MAG: sulfotransferase family protein [bacterium]